jgi:6,7-dimethyl-8-ribityllumazine synthase
MSDTFDRSGWDDEPAERDETTTGPSEPVDEPFPSLRQGGPEDDALEHASENVLESWPQPPADLVAAVDEPSGDEGGTPVDEPFGGAGAEDPFTPPAGEPPGELPPEEPAALGSVVHEPHAETASHVVGEHAPGELLVPPGVPVLEGQPRGERRAVGIVVSRFNGQVTSRLLDSALAELRVCGVSDEAVTVMPVPGAFELPLAAMALAKTRRFACIVALGCVIRGDTPHFDYVAAEAASGLQLAAIDTGVPVAFGVLTLDSLEQADARADKGAEAVRTALEMADLFAHLRAAAAR